jgi:PhzF family phenazine biosynthesis protein
MKYFVIDAFTDEIFGGNPAGVCVMDSWPDAKMMQKIAGENNLAETAFLVKSDSGAAYDLRWFTPWFEMDLCGHATLASAFAVLNFFEKDSSEVVFNTQSGVLTVSKTYGGLLEMDFPSRMPVKIDNNIIACESFNAPVLESFQSRDMVLLFEKEEQVRDIEVDAEHLHEVHLKELVSESSGFIVTAPSSHEGYDFVSRYFDPDDAIFEDPVTGSAHSTLIPFWAKRIGKSELVAKQLSERGGTLYCKDCGDRVKIAGSAKLYLQGEIHI